MPDRIWAQPAPPAVPIPPHFQQLFWTAFTSSQFSFYTGLLAPSFTITNVVNQALGNTSPPLCWDGSWIYYWNNNTNTIGRMRFNGTSITNNFIAVGAGQVGKISTDGVKLYWARGGGGSIGRANLDGSGVQTTWIGTGPPGMAIDSNFLYAINGANIDKYNLSTGALITASFITLGITGTHCCVDSNFLYACIGGAGGSIVRAPIGGGAAATITTGLPGPTHIFTDGTTLFFTGFTSQTIGGVAGQNYAGAVNNDGSNPILWRIPSGAFSNAVGGIINLSVLTK